MISIRRFASQLALIAVTALGGGCGVPVSPPMPSAEFIVVAGDSTFWVRSSPEGVRIRRSSVFLASFGGRFHEIYVADDDRSFFDAVLVGQRIFRRDLISGDSVVVYDDALIREIAKAYAADHPGDRLLMPDEEASEDPHDVATTETDIVNLVGPFLTFEQHLDLDMADGRDAHTTKRGVVDLRSGRQASLASIVGEQHVVEVIRRGRSIFEATLDSVRSATDERARRAAIVIAGFEFDTNSYALTALDSGPAIAFLVPGRGRSAGGLSLELPPVSVQGQSWWTDARRVLPAPNAQNGDDEWHGNSYDVIARYDSIGESALLLLRDRSGHEWTVTRLPAPARRFHALDTPPVDSTAIRALARAFDDAVLYSDQARTAVIPRGTPRSAVLARPATFRAP